MIIEIKNIPTYRLVNRVKFEIEFENVIRLKKDDTIEPKLATKSNTPIKVPDFVVTTESFPTTILNRDSVPVPDEMLNVEL